MITVFFKTYGCQANVADSDGLMRYLSELGCEIVAREELADIIIVNSCAVRDKAEQKMFSYLGRLTDYKKQKSYLKIAVIGCVASYKKQELYDRFAHVNFVFGAREDIKGFQTYLFDTVTSLSTVKQLMIEQEKKSKALAQKDKAFFPAYRAAALLPAKTKILTKAQPSILAFSEAKKSFINIMTGCNKYCSYCIVPFTRGREKSYSLASIVAEVTREVEKGSREITLIGQNVNSYFDQESNASFADLLKSVARIPGEFWVRYVSPHPKDMTRDVLEVMKEYSDTLCGWVHMPLQSGSDRILDAMNRPYSVERYMEIISWIREFLPNATITTDIIVGFPGEEQEDYEKTREVVDRVRYDMSYSFVYSKRKYTKAFSLPDDVPYSVKQQRLAELQERQKQLCFENLARLINKKVKVLVEKRSSHDKLLARTEGNVRVLFEGSDSLIGTFAYVAISSAGTVNVEGVLV